MEDLEPNRRPDWGRFLTLLVALGVMAAVLGTLLAVVLSGAEAVTGKQKAGMVRLAVVCVAMLGLTAVVMFWLVLRFVGSRLGKPLEHTKTEHVDAWRLAGQRVAPLEPPEEGEEPPPEGEGPPPGEEPPSPPEDGRPPK